jgi:hypothetical protein
VLVAKELLQGSKHDAKSPPEFAAIWTEVLKKFLAQIEIIEKLTKSNEWWIGRCLSEANLASKLAANIGQSRSIPEAIRAWQEWSGRRFEMVATVASR